MNDPNKNDLNKGALTPKTNVLGLGLKQLRLAQGQQSFDNLEDGEVAPLHQLFCDLPLRWPRKCDFLRQSRVSGDELLNDAPPLGEDLHERSVVGSRTNDQVALFVPDYPVALALP